jgi:TIR domain/GRAM domain
MRLFVSYAHENTAAARQLADILTAGGHSVSFDQQLLPGQDWKRELGEQISGCEAFVYALTQAAMMSEWCQWEFATAVRLQKSVIPVLLEAGVVMPDSLRRLQYADLTQGATPVAVAKLMLALMSLQKVPAPESPPIPADPTGVPSRAWGSIRQLTAAIFTPLHKPRNEAEEILGKFSADLLRGVVFASGHIILTNQRLLFEAHPFNVQWGQLAIQLDDIREVTASNTYGILPNGMTVHCRSGERYRFVVWGRKRIIGIIQQHRRILPS